MAPKEKQDPKKGKQFPLTFDANFISALLCRGKAQTKRSLNSREPIKEIQELEPYIALVYHSSYQS